MARIIQPQEYSQSGRQHGAADHISVVWSLAPPITSVWCGCGLWRRRPHQCGVVFGAADHISVVWSLVGGF